MRVTWSASPDDAREELARPADLGALCDADLRAPRDESVAGEMERQGTGGGAGCGVLGDAVGRREHACFPGETRAGEDIEPHQRHAGRARQRASARRNRA